jgi:hypothetical protein
MSFHGRKITEIQVKEEREDPHDLFLSVLPHSNSWHRNPGIIHDQRHMAFLPLSTRTHPSCLIVFSKGKHQTMAS